MRRSLKVRHITVVQAIVIVLALAFISLYLVLTLKRVFYPYEMEWMEGSCLESALRIYHGQPLYARPTIYFVNWLYPPLSYYMTAAMIPIFGATCTAGRVVSFASTIITAGLISWCVYFLTRGSRIYSFAATGLYLACYALVGYYFDIVRADAPFVALLVASLVLVLRAERPPNLVLSALFVVLAIFTKQQAVYYVFPVALWLFLNRRRDAVIYLVAVAVFWGIGTALFVHENGQWYWFYVYKVPGAKSGDFRFARMMFVFSWYVFSGWGIASLAVLASIVALATRQKGFLRSRQGLVALLLACATGHVMMHLGDFLTYRNSTMPFAAIISLALPYFLWSVAPLIGERYRAYFVWPMVLQFFASVYNPNVEGFGIPTAADRQGAKAFIDTVQAMKGNVLVRNHNISPFLVGKLSFANDLAMNDAIEVGDSVAHNLARERDEALRAGFYDAIITDEGSLQLLDSIPGYSVARLMNSRGPVFRSSAGGGRTEPRYLLVREPQPSVLGGK